MRWKKNILKSINQFLFEKLEKNAEESILPSVKKSLFFNNLLVVEICSIALFTLIK